jgi:hypothetical protein
VSLTAWETFYVIIGSAAAGLTGLMFVAIALLADVRANLKSAGRQIDAFATPTVVHFGAVLLQSAILTAPWPTMAGVRIALGIYGSAGAIYTVIVLNRARRQTDYKPVFEDWLFHAVLPLAAYLSVAAAALGLPRNPTSLLFVIGSAGALLLFVVIPNA